MKKIQKLNRHIFTKKIQTRDERKRFMKERKKEILAELINLTEKVELYKVKKDFNPLVLIMTRTDFILDAINKSGMSKSKIESSIDTYYSTIDGIREYYQQKIDLIAQVSIFQASTYIGYHQYYTRIQSLTEIPESPLGTIEVDGNNDDWNKAEINYIQLKSDSVAKPEGWNFPLFEKMLVTRTTKGIYEAISLSNENLTELMRSQGTLEVKLYWATVIAEVDGSYAADYALETYLTYNDVEQYITQNVTLTGASGIDLSPEFTTWQLQSNQSGTNLCFECFFPKEMIHPLYQPTL